MKFTPLVLKPPYLILAAEMAFFFAATAETFKSEETSSLALKLQLPFNQKLLQRAVAISLFIYLRHRHRRDRDRTLFALA